MCFDTPLSPRHGDVQRANECFAQCLYWLSRRTLWAEQLCVSQRIFCMVSHLCCAASTACFHWRSTQHTSRHMACVGNGIIPTCNQPKLLRLGCTSTWRALPLSEAWKKMLWNHQVKDSSFYSWSLSGFLYIPHKMTHHMVRNLLTTEDNGTGGMCAALHQLIPTLSALTFLALMIM